MTLFYEADCPYCKGTGSTPDGFDGCYHCMGLKKGFLQVTDPKMLQKALKKLTKKPISKLGKAV